jgi:hypothetical protein
VVLSRALLHSGLDTIVPAVFVLSADAADEKLIRLCAPPSVLFGVKSILREME